MQLAVTVDFTALGLGRFAKLGLPLVISRPLRKGFAQPRIKAAGVNTQHAAMALTAKISRLSAMKAWLTGIP